MHYMVDKIPLEEKSYYILGRRTYSKDVIVSRREQNARAWGKKKNPLRHLKFYLAMMIVSGSESHIGELRETYPRY